MNEPTTFYSVTELCDHHLIKSGCFMLQLIQAVDHPYLVIYSRANCLRNENVAEDDNGEQICGICHDPAEDPTVR